MSSDTGKRALTIVVFIVAFLAVKYGMQSYREHESAAKVEGLVNQLQTDATRKHPGVPASDAVRQEAMEQATKKLASEAGDLNRANTAADIFWGFYFANVRVRPEFCREQGIDIRPFVEAFQRSHMNELAKARSIYARSSVDENKLYAGFKAQARRMIIQDMNGIAASNSVGVKEACQLVADNADVLVADMHLSKSQPAVFQALSAVK